jgi:hypothetical protein
MLLQEKLEPYYISYLFKESYLIIIFVIKKIDKQSKYYSINIRRKCFLKKVNQN